MVMVMDKITKMTFIKMKASIPKIVLITPMAILMITDEELTMIHTAFENSIYEREKRQLLHFIVSVE